MLTGLGGLLMSSTTDTFSVRESWGGTVGHRVRPPAGNCTTLLVKLNLFTYLRTKSLKRSYGIEL